MNKKWLRSAFLITGGSLLISGCVVREREVRYRNPPPPPPPAVIVESPGVAVDVNGPPPPDIIETQTIAPGPGFVWVGGYYEWGPRGGWAWRRGYWGRPPHPGMMWGRPHYEYRGGRHVWVRGGWR